MFLWLLQFFLAYWFDNILLIEIHVVQQQNETGKIQKQQNKINLVCSTRIQSSTVIREVRYCTVDCMTVCDCVSDHSTTKMTGAIRLRNQANPSSIIQVTRVYWEQWRLRSPMTAGTKDLGQRYSTHRRSICEGVFRAHSFVCLSALTTWKLSSYRSDRTDFISHLGLIQATRSVLVSTVPL